MEVLIIVLLLIALNIYLADKVGSNTVLVTILTFPFGILVTAYLLIRLATQDNPTPTQITQPEDQVCETCKYALPYAEPYVNCTKIKTTFPKKHFCAYYRK